MALLLSVSNIAIIKRPMPIHLLEQDCDMVTSSFLPMTSEFRLLIYVLMHNLNLVSDLLPSRPRFVPKRENHVPESAPLRKESLERSKLKVNM